MTDSLLICETLALTVIPASGPGPSQAAVARMLRWKLIYLINVQSTRRVLRPRAAMTDWETSLFYADI